ncbi:2-oxo acid dehydrogenase subunit E2 [Maribellus maritimus]|uniref:2-oxo acid dehydrogenase subunit E2 n=1 Tax=Maribellus maritimus TaxID=2870838 RepID=UPI001EEA2C66|nr:2-oxo acid dehydrogenase subunit E2 [Maribellus maritimus]MCG6187604.1 2-oxo acid dehydrogenase subunit E2 [Maribellus maritimus]
MDSPQNFNTNWRKVASTIYRKPVDSKIYGSVELDVTELEKYISSKRKEGIKITLTHVITLIIGRAIKLEVPELNTFVKRGKIVNRPQIDAMVSVLLQGGEMGSVKIENIDTLNITELSEEIAKKIKASRKGNENNTMQSKDSLSKIPWPFRSWVFYLYRLFTIHWGFSFPVIKLSANSFGSYVVSNIGTLGLDSGYGALLPSANVSIVMILGGVNKKPTVVNDKIVPRKILSLSATLDHRVVDGSHGGKLFRVIKQMIKNPYLLDEHI